MKLIFLTIFVSLPLAAETPSLTSTLKSMIAICSHRDLGVNATCAAYITGFIQGWKTTLEHQLAESFARNVETGRVAPTVLTPGTAQYEAMDRFLKNAFTEETHKVGVCIESDWTAGYVQAVLVQYGLEHPDRLNEPASDVMFDILRKAFPCTKQPAKTSGK